MMLKTIRGALTLAMAATFLAVASQSLATSPHERDGWVLGLSYGGARGEGTAANDVGGETEDGVAPQIRFGHMVGKRLSVGASYSGWMYETGTLPIKYRFTIQNILLAASWYPGNPENVWGGLVIRSGVGWGWANFTEIEIMAEAEQGHGDRTTEWGLGYELNISYEWRLTDAVSAGLGLGVNHADIAGKLYDKATFYPVTLNLGWYWD